MPTLNIGDHKVKVDDGFLKLSPDEQNAAVEEIAKSLGGREPAAAAPQAAAAPVVEQPLPAQAAVPAEPKSTLQTIREAIHAPTRALENGLLMGFGDRIRSGMGAMIGDGSYGDNLKKENVETDRFRTAHPILAPVAEGIGNVAMPLGAIGAAAKGTTLGSKFLLGAGAGAGIGGVQGFAESRDWTNLPQTGKDTAMGAGIGATIGGAIPVVGKAAGAGYRAIADVIRGRADGFSRRASSHLVNAMEADGSAAVRAQLDRLGPDGMLADAGPAFLGKAQGASLNSDEGRSILQGALTRRNEGTNARIQDDVNRALGPAEDPQTVTNTIRARRSEVDNVAYPNALDLAPDIRTGAMLTELEGYIPQTVGMENRALTNLRDMMTRIEQRPRLDRFTGRQEMDANGNLLFDPIRVNQTDARVLHKVKNELDNVIEHDAPGLGVPAAALQNSQYALKQFRHQLNQTLEHQVPGYREANAHSARLAQRAEAVEAGTQYLGEGKTTPSPGRFLDEHEQRDLGTRIAFAKGSRGEIERKLGTKSNDLQALRSELQGEGGWNTAKIATVHGDEAANELMASVERNLKFRDTHHKVVENSQTAQRLSASNAMKPSSINESDLVRSNSTGVGMLLTAAKRGGLKVLNAATEASQNRARGEVARALTAQGAERDQHYQAIVDAILKRQGNAAAAPAAGNISALVAAMIANGAARGGPSQRQSAR